MFFMQKTDYLHGSVRKYLYKMLKNMFLCAFYLFVGVTTTKEKKTHYTIKLLVTSMFSFSQLF